MWKEAKTDVDRALIEARATLIKRGYMTKEEKNELRLAKNIKDTLY